MVRLAAYYNHNGERFNIRAANVTRQVRFAARTLQHQTSIQPVDLSAHSVQASGAMALLCGRCNNNTIQLLGRWHGSFMLRYLHMEAQPVFKQLAQKMFNHGTYNFLPTVWVPDAD